MTRAGGYLAGYRQERKNRVQIWREITVTTIGRLRGRSGETSPSGEGISTKQLTTLYFLPLATGGWGW
jgi:hypothetical protein